jgi:hypothetical protein
VGEIHRAATDPTNYLNRIPFGAIAPGFTVKLACFGAFAAGFSVRRSPLGAFTTPASDFIVSAIRFR